MSWRGAIKAGTDTAVDILKEDAKANRAAELYQLKRQNSYDDSLKLHEEKKRIDGQTAKTVLDSNYGFKNLKEFDTQIRTQAQEAIGKSATEGWGRLKGKDVTKNAWDKSAHATDLSKVYKAAYSSGMKELSVPVLSNKLLVEAKVNHDRKMKNKWVTDALGDYKDPMLEGLRGNMPMEWVSGKVALQQKIDTVISGTSSQALKEAQVKQIRDIWESRTKTKWSQH